MCLTGGFALSMVLDPVVLAPVLAQPGLPATRPGALDISPADLERVKARSRRPETARLSVRRRHYLPGLAFPNPAHRLGAALPARNCPTVPLTPPA